MATKAKSEEKSPSGFDLASTLKRLEKLAGTGGYPTLTISPSKTKTILSATNNGVTVETVLPEKLPGLEGAWNFAYPTLSTAIANRQGLSLSLNESTLTIKNKQFSSKLIGSEASSVPRATEPTEATCEFELNGDTRTLLSDALSAVYLQKSLSALPDITVHLSFKAKTISVTAFDKSQMASYVAANTTGQQFELTLPTPKAEALVKGLLGDATVKAADGVMYAKSGLFRMSVSLPPPEEAAGVPIQRVVERSAQLRKMTLPKEVVFKKEDLVNFLDNAKALSKSSAMLKMVVSSSGKTQVAISADGNSIEASIKSKSKEDFECYLDIAYVQALLMKSKSEGVAIAFDDSIFIFRDENLVYSAVLSTPPESANKSKSKKTTGKKASTEEDEEEEA